MTRVLPDGDLLVLEAIRGALPDMKAGTRLPQSLDGNLPFVVAVVVSPVAVNYEPAVRSTVDVQVWASDRKAASDLAEDVRQALVAAWRSATVYTSGHVAHYSATALPAEVRDDTQPDGLFRFQATYSLTLRPPTP